MYFVPYLDETGVHIPTYADRLEQLKNDYSAIFGPDTELTPYAPDYQLLSVFAKALDDMSALIVSLWASHNPNYARGASLDLLMPLCAMQRLSASPSTVTLSLTGTPLTSLPEGLEAADAAGHCWITDEAATLDTDGNALAAAHCSQTGPVAAAANTICLIRTPAAGWTAVTNPSAAIPGRDTETDAEARLRRDNAVSLPSAAISESILASLNSLPNVAFSRLLVNDTDETDDYDIPAHSLCAVVDGGSSADIARTIFTRKSPGVGTYGTSSAQVTDAFGETHTVSFIRATFTTASVAVVLKKLPGYNESAMAAAIPQAISAYISTLGIGEKLVVPVLYGIAYTADPSETPTFTVLSVRASAASQTSAEVIEPAFSERIRCYPATVQITVRE